MADETGKMMVKQGFCVAGSGFAAGFRRALVRQALVAGLALLPVACGGESVAGAEAPPVVAGTDGAPADPVPLESPVASRNVGSGLGLGKYLAGRLAQEHFDSANAAAYYVQALKADPGNVTLANRAYFYLLAEGQMKPALELAQRVMELDPSSSIAPLVLAAGDVSENHYQKASDRLHKVPQRGLNSFVVPLMRAWALAGQKRWDEALKTLEPLSRQAQTQALYNFHAGLILDLAGRDKEAWERYQATLSASDSPSLRSVEVAWSFLARHNRMSEADELVASWRARHPDSELAASVLAGLDRDSKTRPVADARQGMAEALYGAASSVVQANALDTGLVFARLAMMLRPDFSFSEMMVGDILFNQHRYADAVEVFGRIPQSSPVWFSVRLRMAEALDGADKPAEAEKLLRELAARVPASADPWISLGDLLRRQEKWDPAVAAYRQALERYPDKAKLPWGLYYSLGIAQERGGHWEDAEESLLNALKVEPEQPLVLNYLGYSWIDRGKNLEQGKAMIERAVQQRPTDGYIIDSLGWAYYLTGDYGKAVQALERAIEYAPADPTINDHLGDALWRVGRQNEARFQWQRALGLSPEDEQEKSLRRKLVEGLPAAGEK